MRSGLVESHHAAVIDHIRRRLETPSTDPAVTLECLIFAVSAPLLAQST